MLLRIVLLTLSLYTGIRFTAYGQKVDTATEKGLIEGGYKVGIWAYYDKPHPAEPVLRVDYTKNQLLYIEPDTSTYTVKIGGAWQASKTERQPRYLGSLATVYHTLAMHVNYPRTAVAQRETSTVFLYFEIDSLGKAGNLQTFSLGSPAFEDEVKQAFALVPNYWLAARVGGVYVPSSFIMPITFKLSDQDGEPIADEGGLTLPQANRMSSLVIVGYGAPATNKASREKKKK